MTEITITESVKNQKNILYLQTGIIEKLSNTDCEVKVKNSNDRAEIKLLCPEQYLDVVKCEIVDMIAEVVVIGYKYEFLKNTLKICGLSEDEKEILLTSLISADLFEDKRWVIDQLKEYNEISIDGVYNFRLAPLKNKWNKVVGYMPSVFVSEQLNDFVGYLLENKTKRAYVSNGRVYDWRYVRLKRCNLLDYQSLKVIRELLFSNCGEVELKGKIPLEDENYIKAFYKDKIIFSADNYS